MPVKTITAEIDGQTRKITADIPDGASNDDLVSAVQDFISAQPKPKPTYGPSRDDLKRMQFMDPLAAQGFLRSKMPDSNVPLLSSGGKTFAEGAMGVGDDGKMGTASIPSRVGKVASGSLEMATPLMTATAVGGGYSAMADAIQSGTVKRFLMSSLPKVATSLGAYYGVKKGANAIGAPPAVSEIAGLTAGGLAGYGEGKVGEFLRSIPEDVVKNPNPLGFMKWLANKPKSDAVAAELLKKLQADRAASEAMLAESRAAGERLEKFKADAASQPKNASRQPSQAYQERLPTPDEVAFESRPKVIRNTPPPDAGTVAEPKVQPEISGRKSTMAPKRGQYDAPKPTATAHPNARNVSPKTKASLPAPADTAPTQTVPAVDVSTPQARGQLLAAVLKKANADPQLVKMVSPAQWKVIAKSAGLSEPPDPETIAAAIQEMQKPAPSIRMRRR